MEQMLKSLEKGPRVVTLDFLRWAGNKAKYAINLDGSGYIAWIRKEDEPKLYYLLNEEDHWTCYGSM